AIGATRPTAPTSTSRTRKFGVTTDMDGFFYGQLALVAGRMLQHWAAPEAVTAIVDSRQPGVKKGLIDRRGTRDRDGDRRRSATAPALPGARLGGHEAVRLAIAVQLPTQHGLRPRPEQNDSLGQIAITSCGRATHRCRN